MAAAPYLDGSLPVVDTHIHLTSHSLLEYPVDFDQFLRSCGAKHGQPDGRECGDFSEADYLDAVAVQSKLSIRSGVFVEVLPTEAHAVDEALWVLKMIDDPCSKMEALVAHIPVREGAAAVKRWVADLLAQTGRGCLPPMLKGARQVMADVASDEMTSNLFLDALRELGLLGLHFEFCVQASQLPSVLAAVRAAPGTRFVLDHCGLNSSGQDMEAWKDMIFKLAACENLIACKLSAIEEWEPVDGDPAPYLDHALASFGSERCMYGGNWFVPVEFGTPYGRTADLVGAALDRMGASEAQAADVFANTARRTYGLS